MQTARVEQAAFTIAGAVQRKNNNQCQLVYMYAVLQYVHETDIRVQYAPAFLLV